MKTGLVAGCFDILHYGYFELFRDAKTVCDHLLVALHVDPSVERPHKARPLHTTAERVKMLSAIRYVDGVVTYETEDELVAIALDYSIDVRIVGSDYRGREEEISGRATELYIHERDERLSATYVRQRGYQLQLEADERSGRK